MEVGFIFLVGVMSCTLILDILRLLNFSMELSNIVIMFVVSSLTFIGLGIEAVVNAKNNRFCKYISAKVVAVFIIYSVYTIFTYIRYRHMP